MHQDASIKQGNSNSRVINQEHIKVAENKFSDGKAEIQVVEIIITETLHERSRKGRLKTGHNAEDKLCQHDALCQK